MNVTKVPLPEPGDGRDAGPMTLNTAVFHPEHGRCLFVRALVTQPGRAYIEKKKGTLLNVSIAELKTIAHEIAHREAVAAAFAEGRQLLMPSTTCDYKAHVNSNACMKVRVEVGKQGGFEKFSDWYTGVTGEILTGLEEWIVTARPDDNWEPRVHLPYHDNMLLPHPVVAAGTVGKGHGLETPQFLFHYPMTLENNYQSYFEGILRAGWRP